MTSKLLTAYKQQINEFKLIPGAGGCFEISLNGELIYSKLKTGKFPEDKWVLDSVKKALK